ncbi:MAG: hypothetical protein D6725_01275 [Planctomycetota bacterium]|nr:MAG: hypothetical protein D6725_01275 [Planctomycetota bacterium]
MNVTSRKDRRNAMDHPRLEWSASRDRPERSETPQQMLQNDHRGTGGRLAAPHPAPRRGVPT